MDVLRHSAGECGGINNKMGLWNRPELCDCLGQIGAFLEQANCGEAGGTGGKALPGVFHRHAADGEHRNAHSAADLGQPVETLRRAESRFGRCRIDGAEDDVVGATALSFL